MGMESPKGEAVSDTPATLVEEAKVILQEAAKAVKWSEDGYPEGIMPGLEGKVAERAMSALSVLERLGEKA